MEFLNQLQEILVTFVISVLSIVIPTLGVYVGNFLKVKIEHKKNAIGEQEYNKNVQMAIDIATIIEERFRLGELANSKVEEFEKMMLEKVPTLTKDEIEYLRNLAVKTLNDSIVEPVLPKAN